MALLDVLVTSRPKLKVSDFSEDSYSSKGFFFSFGVSERFKVFKGFKVSYILRYLF